MRRQDDGMGFLLLMIIILPIVLFVLFFKVIAKAVSGISEIKNNSTSYTGIHKRNNGIIPSDDDIDRYEMYDAFFDDED